MQENLENNLYDIQQKNPLKTKNSFLYDYWNLFFLLYSKKIKEKFKKNNIKKPLELFDSISINNILIKNSNCFKERNNMKNEINKNNTMANNSFNNFLLNILVSNICEYFLCRNQIRNIELRKNFLLSNLQKIISKNNNAKSFFQKYKKFENNPERIDNDDKPFSNSSIQKAFLPIFIPVKNNLFAMSDIIENEKKNKNNENSCLNRNKDNILNNQNVCDKENHSFKVKSHSYINKTNSNINETTVQKDNQVKKRKNKIFNIVKSPSHRNKVNNFFLCSKKRKRMIKNKKLVFIQDQNQKQEKDFDCNYYIEENKEDKLKYNLVLTEFIQNNIKSRGSKYRGVSKNGSQWQVLIMIKKKKKYMGSYSKEEEAARIYDKIALLYHGTKAKTNFDYTKEEIEKILSMNKKNMNDEIKNL